jgi:hypothetical protein
VILAKDPNYGGKPVLLAIGAVASNRQKIFSIIPSVGKMRVNIQIPEELVGRVKSGRPVRIRVDAFADQVLTGIVESINSLPEMIHSGMVHSTRVAIEKPLSGFRPGMSAEVEILGPAD